MSLFERRYENGYDLRDDDRYNYWLAKSHPESAMFVEPLQCGSTAVSRFLTCPSPPARSESYKPKSCGTPPARSESYKPKSCSTGVHKIN